MSEPQPYRFNISLRLSHPKADLSVCSEEFGLAPIRQWIKGHARASPRGESLIGTWRDSYWTANIESSSHEDLETALAETIDLLSAHAEFLASHLASNGSASLFIGLFLKQFNSGFTLEPTLQSKFASLGVSLEFDIYGSIDTPDAP